MAVRSARASIAMPRARSDNRRLAAVISASAPLEAWTEDTAPGAATVVAAETDFAFMEKNRESGDGRTGRALSLSSRPARTRPGQTPAFRSDATGCIAVAV